MEWISVNDKMPEIGQKVLCYNSYEGIKETKYTTYLPGSYGHDAGLTDCWFEWITHNSRTWHYNATHWMPLPEPPKTFTDESK